MKKPIPSEPQDEGQQEVREMLEAARLAYAEAWTNPQALTEAHTVLGAMFDHADAAGDAELVRAVMRVFQALVSQMMVVVDNMQAEDTTP